MKYQISESVRVEELNGELVVLDSANGVVHRLEGNAAAVVRAAQEGESISEELTEVARGLSDMGIIVPAGMSRRSLISGVAMSAVIVSGVTTLALPGAAAAASTGDETITYGLGGGGANGEIPASTNDSDLDLVYLVDMLTATTCDITLSLGGAAGRTPGYVYQYRTSTSSSADSGGTWQSWPAWPTTDVTISGVTVSPSKVYVQVRKRTVNQGVRPNNVTKWVSFSVGKTTTSVTNSATSTSDVSLGAAVGSVFVTLEGAQGGQNADGDATLTSVNRTGTLDVRGIGDTGLTRKFRLRAGGAGQSAVDSESKGTKGVNNNASGLDGSDASTNGAGGGGAASAIEINDGASTVISIVGVDGGAGGSAGGGAGGAAPSDSGFNQISSTSPSSVDPSPSDASLRIHYPVVDASVTVLTWA